ncbi:PAS/PAC sensor(s)-containing diguanylate cyclase/phosphodiesterase [Cupriavidus basilensis OR16]|uniref:PAS/PAC sensor(S)-containing diguanylate cyclase/phosphodiesterase n=1 Tax=Cupriavidus basilensis OR16 TaxID=1127483 RepID=H1S9L7_9BURK|nr:EAL domain-containing protein [Cupriavidus basilensis]EHP40793.1 PAS/PAC sensor(s)-containing diguanylate cyclase/phosphodiesterase [Cupriavidus basilensis OR16]
MDDSPQHAPFSPSHAIPARIPPVKALPTHVAAMLDSIADGIMLLDREWRFTYVNQATERLLKRSLTDLGGRGIWECYPDLIGSAYYRAYHEAAASGAPRTCTAYHAPLACWLEARAFPDANGLTVIFRDVSRERQQSAQLEYHADHDYLTGLPNRRRCTQVLAHAVAQAGEAGVAAPLAGIGAQEPYAAGVVVLFVDLDRFKEVNDAFGHAVGDTLLCGVAERFRALLAPSAFVARVGGDEFVFILRDARPGQAERFAGTILAGVSQPFQVDGHTLLLGASVGIAQWPEAGDTADTLLNHADAAMYAAKAAGRFQFRVFHLDLAQGLRQRLQLRADLHAAMADDQLVLHFQPQWSLQDGRLAGAEALLRWQHPTRGLLPPASFLDVLLESPLEPAVGLWVMRAVCRQIAAWRRAGLPVPRISLNLSARQLVMPGLAGLLADLAREHEVPCGLLDVEVTENTLMTDLDSAAAALDELKRCGISASLDDFGSGYSSLAYLTRLPVATLKIDKSFVAVLGSAPEALAVIRGVIALARSLGMRTLAEGVETRDQQRLLAGEGCDAVQGYLLGRPMPAADFAAVMGASAVARGD